MAVALADFGFAVGFVGQGAGFEFAGPGAEAHRAAHFVYAQEFAQFIDDAMRCLRIEFSAVGLLEAGGVACVFDCGALHAEADAEKGNFVIAGVLDGVDHALDAALAEAAGNENAVVALEPLFRGFERIDFLGFDPVDDGFVMIREAAVQQGFAQTFVGVFELDIFADDADVHFAFGMVQAPQHVEPRLHVGGALFEAEEADDLRVEAFFAELDGDFVNCFHVFHGNNAGFGDVAEEGYFFLEILGDVAIASAKKDIGLNADAEHFFDRMLGRLGLEFAGGGDVGNESDVNEQRVFGSEFEAHLANGFEERQGFDVADCASDFDDDNVDTFSDASEAAFDFVGDVGNDLDGFSEVIAAALLGENGFVDAAAGPVIVAGKLDVGEAFVVAEVEVGFSTIVGDKDFAVLIRAHSAGIHVQVRVTFLDGDFKAATFEETTDGRCRYALTERRNNTASYKDIFWRHPGCSPPHRAELSLSNLRRIDVHIIIFGSGSCVNEKSLLERIGKFS